MGIIHPHNIRWPQCELIEEPRRRYYLVTQDDGTIHEVDTSVSTVCQGIGRIDGLIWYNVSLTIEYLQDKKNAGEFKKAQTHHKNVLKENGDFGTFIHNLIAGIMLLQPEANTILNQEAKNCLSAFYQWLPQQDIAEVVAVERSVVCWEPFPHSGTFDALWRDSKGRWHLADWKTATSLWPKNRVQLGGYARILRLMHGIDVYQAHLVRLDKKLAVPEEVIIERPELVRLGELFVCELKNFVNYTRLEKYIKEQRKL